MLVFDAMYACVLSEHYPVPCTVTLSELPGCEVRSMNKIHEYSGINFPPARLNTMRDALMRVCVISYSLLELNVLKPTVKITALLLT